MWFYDCLYTLCMDCEIENLGKHFCLLYRWIHQLPRYIWTWLVLCPVWLLCGPWWSLSGPWEVNYRTTMLERSLQPFSWPLWWSTSKDFCSKFWPSTTFQSVSGPLAPQSGHTVSVIYCKFFILCKYLIPQSRWFVY